MEKELKISKVKDIVVKKITLLMEGFVSFEVIKIFKDIRFSLALITGKHNEIIFCDEIRNRLGKLNYVKEFAFWATWT